MKSNPALVSSGKWLNGKPLVKSCRMMRSPQFPVYPARQRAMFFFMRSRARLLFSTKTTKSALRLNASRPMAPVPAKRSSTFAPWMDLPRILNRASLALSEVGLILLSRGGGVKSFRPFCVPLIILKISQN